MPFDLLFYATPKHAERLGRELPELPMVNIDHLAKPHIKDQSFDDWLPQPQAAAQHDHIFCKLSGMITEADWAN